MCEAPQTGSNAKPDRKKITVQVVKTEFNENPNKDTQSHYNNLATLVLSLSTLNLTVAEKMNMPDWLYQIVGLLSLAASAILVLSVAKTEVKSFFRWIGGAFKSKKIKYIIETDSNQENDRKKIYILKGRIRCYEK